MDDWETFVVPHFDKVVDCLRPSLLMDKLRAKRRLTRSEYSELHSLGTEKDRSQKLINDLLPAKGPGTLKDFCMILREVDDPGQEYIADLIENRPMSRDNPVGSDAQSTAHSEIADLQQGSRRGIARKRKHNPEEEYGFSSPTRGLTALKSPKTATFFFKPDHRPLINSCLGDMIKSLCQEGFGIETDNVLFGYCDIKKCLKDLGYPVYSDIDAKLAVLIVSGVEPAQVQKYRDNLEQCIITIFRQSDFTLPEDASRVLEILPNCSFIVLHLTTPAFLALLCALSDKQSRERLSGSLRRALPGSRKMVLRLGGLPPLELPTNSTMMPGDEKQGKLVRPYQLNQMVSCSLSAAHMHATCLKQQADHSFADVDSLTDSLAQTQKEVAEVRARLKYKQTADLRERKRVDQKCLIRTRLRDLAVTRAKIFLSGKLERYYEAVESWRQSRLVEKVAESAAHCQTLIEGLKCSLGNIQLLNKQDTDLPVGKWGKEDVAAFIKSQAGLSDLAVTLLENDVDGSLLLKLTEEDLKKGLEIKSFGKQKKLLEVIEKLNQSSPRDVGRVQSTSSDLAAATTEGKASATRGLAKISIRQELRTYQEELIVKISKARTKNQNVVVCAPTGSGKTLVAVRHCADVITEKQSIHCEGDPNAYVYFIVPTVHLVDQQAKYIESNLVGVRVGQITGDRTEGTTLYEQSQINDIVVLTPAIFVNALKEWNPQVKLSDVLLLVFDECHHAEKNHPYMQIMDIYLEQKFEVSRVRGSLPHILGITATLGMGSVSTPRDAESHVLTLCANLDSPKIVRVSDHRDELYQYVPHPDTELMSVSRRAMEDPFHLETVKIMTRIQRKTSLLEKPYEHGSREYETIINQYRVTLEENGDHEALFYVKMLIAYNRGLQVYQDMRKEEALEFFQRTFDDVATVAEGNSKLIRMMQNERQSIVDQLQTLEAVHSLPNPKLEALKSLLLDEFKQYSKAKGMVFMKTREFTRALVNWINSNDDLSDKVKPKRLVGGGSETKDQMTKADQLQAIRSFSKGDCNLLVATTIGEEGLDIPECNFVIRYETVTSEIGEVQARGRARVRLQSSRFVEIVTRGSANEAHAKANKYRERLMNEASEAVGCLPESELLNEIQKRQMDRLKQVSEKAKRLQAKHQRSKAPDVRLRCKQCGIDVCQASEILRIGTFYVVRGASLERKVNKVRKGPDRKMGKTYCKNCGADWGALIQFANGEETPALKCTGFLFNVSGNLKAIKKWKDVPFEVQEGSEGDLN